MQLNEIPDQRYTLTWSGGRGEVKFLRRSESSRLRYFTVGTGPPLVLLHTVRTQLDYFQRVVPAVWDDFTVYALDLPGMGWSDVVPGRDTESPNYAAPSSNSSRHWTCVTSRWRANRWAPRWRCWPRSS